MQIKGLIMNFRSRVIKEYELRRKHDLHSLQGHKLRVLYYKFLLWRMKSW